MHYTESSNVINLTNALPVTDEVGKNQTDYFDFSITSNADTNADDNEGIKIPYNLIIEPKAVDSDKDALTNEQIKVYLTKVEGTTETQVLAPTKISALTTVESNFNLYSTENIHKNNNGMITTNYRLRAWIDYGVDTSTWNQTSKPKQYKFGVNVNATGELNARSTGAQMLIKKVGTGGLVAETHPATEQFAETTDYRYTGDNPDNYITFNNEEGKWRIIGVFDVNDGTGKLEKRIKIIRDSLGEIPWNSTGGTDWSKASGMKLLNEGDYWNRTGDFSSTSTIHGLTDEAKGQIADAVWYLGGTDQYEKITATQFYSYERGKTVDEGKPISWKGKVGLMYPSDYGYATGGGTTTNRDACLAKELSDWHDYDSETSDCVRNDWLDGGNQWTLTPRIGSGSAFDANAAGGVGSSGTYEAYTYLRPTVYLRADIEIFGGSGTELDPYYLTSKSPMPEPVVPAEAVGGAKKIIEKVGTDGLVAESHPSTRQLQSTTDYRYTGANPDNYINFNGEERKWRIIGVFDVDDGTGKLEKRIKIIRDSIGKIAWDDKSDGSYASDWAKSSGMKLLNEGDYWNRTGDFASASTNPGLTDDAKGQIADAVWYLGGARYDGVTASQFYSYERGKIVYDNTMPISWKGKVGLMYPSDYGYATSGGTTTNRDACLAKEIYNWMDLDACKTNDWLYDRSYNQSTITQHFDSSSDAFYVDYRGHVMDNYVEYSYVFRPTVYLSSDIDIVGGDGSFDTPYEIS